MESLLEDLAEKQEEELIRRSAPEAQAIHQELGGSEAGREGEYELDHACRIREGIKVQRSGRQIKGQDQNNEVEPGFL